MLQNEIKSRTVLEYVRSACNTVNEKTSIRIIPADRVFLSALEFISGIYERDGPGIT